MANVKFDGISEDLTAPGTPWIYYGVRINFISKKNLNLLLKSLLCLKKKKNEITYSTFFRVHTLVPDQPICGSSILNSSLGQ